MRTRGWAGVLVAAAAVALAPQAAAEPADLVPYCTGDETPMTTNCRAPSSQVSDGNGPSGLSPNLPFGVNPGVEPEI